MNDNIIIGKKKELEVEAAKLGVQCMNRFYFFFLTFWDCMSGEEFVPAPHIEYLCDTLQYWGMKVIQKEKIMKTIVINVPPGSSKSTIATIAFPIWCWLHAPNLSTANISYSATLSSQHAYKARGITDSRKWHILFDKVFMKVHGKALGIVKQNQNEILNNFKGNRFNTSVGGTILGMHYDIGIKDDILSAEQATSDVEREKGNRWDDETTTSRKKNPQCFLDIYISQRLHEADNCGHVLNKNIDITHICLPAEITSNIKVSPEDAISLYTDGILDPNRRPKDVLDVIKEQMGSTGYSGQYLQMPFNLEEQDIKPSMFEIWDEDKIPAGTYFDVWVDGAYTEKTENDPSGIDLMQRIGNNIVVKRSYDVYKKLPDLLKFLIKLERDGLFDKEKSRIFIEPKASGHSLADYIEADTDYNFVRIGEHNKQESKLVNSGKKSRHEMIKPKAESHRIKLIDGSWNNSFIMQLCGFPRAAHDEHVDNLGYAINHYYMHENSFIDGWALNMLQKNITGSFPVLVTSQVKNKKFIVDFKENDSGKLDLFDNPDKYYLNRYIVVVVLRSEAERNANTCITVFDRKEKSVAAVMQSNTISPTRAGFKALELAYLFEKAKLVVAVKKEVGSTQNEENDLSHMALKELREYEYDNIYSRLSQNDIRKSRAREYGFEINRSSKREIYYYLKDSVEKHKITAMPLPMYNDLKVIERKKETGEIDAREGFEANAILSFGIARKVDDEMMDEVTPKKSTRWA